jgi:hypothetical protein
VAGSLTSAMRTPERIVYLKSPDTSGKVSLDALAQRLLLWSYEFEVAMATKPTGQVSWRAQDSSSVHATAMTVLPRAAAAIAVTSSA